jgi:hypothetical protein
MKTVARRLFDRFRGVFHLDDAIVGAGAAVVTYLVAFGRNREKHHRSLGAAVNEVVGRRARTVIAADTTLTDELLA